MISNKWETIPLKTLIISILWTEGILFKENVNYGDKISNKILDKMVNCFFGNRKWPVN